MTSETEQWLLSGVSFTHWMWCVDAVIARAMDGITSTDLEDASYYDWWDSGVTPVRAARMVLEAQGLYP